MIPTWNSLEETQIGQMFCFQKTASDLSVRATSTVREVRLLLATFGGKGQDQLLSACCYQAKGRSTGRSEPLLQKLLPLVSPNLTLAVLKMSFLLNT